MALFKGKAKETNKEKVLSSLSDWSLAGNAEGCICYKGNENDVYRIPHESIDEIYSAFLEEIKQNLHDWEIVGTKNFDDTSPIMGYFDNSIIKHKLGRIHYNPVDHGIWGFYAPPLRDKWEKIVKLITKKETNKMIVKKKDILENITKWSYGGIKKGEEGVLSLIHWKNERIEFYGEILDDKTEILKTFIEEIKQNPQDWEFVGEENLSVDNDDYFIHTKIKHKSGRTHFTPPHGFWGFNSIETKDEWEKVSRLIGKPKNENSQNNDKIDNPPKEPKKEKPTDYSTWTKEQLIAKIQELEKKIKDLESNSSQDQSLVLKNKNELDLVRAELDKKDVKDKENPNDLKNNSEPKGYNTKLITSLVILAFAVVIWIVVWIWKKNKKK